MTSAQLSRYRIGRRTTAAAAAFALAAVLTGCAAGANDPATGGPGLGFALGHSGPVDAPVGKLVMIIRHGEKPTGKKNAADPGFDATGRLDEHSLTRTGWQRAHALVDVFDGVGPTPPALARPATIYAAGVREEGTGTRTRETVAPLAQRLGVAVDSSYGKGEEEVLARSVAAQPGPTLISWQHSEIPSIAEAFGAVSPAPPTEWPDDRYDVVWTLTRTPDGWRFGQTPQLLLPGDQPAAILE